MFDHVGLPKLLNKIFGSSSNQRRSGSEATHDYSRLPTLVLNEIFGYLSVKERVRCKGVCRTWRQEIELSERKRDTLVVHFGPYLLNMRWRLANDRRLMKFENSLQVKNLTFLKHPQTRALLEKTKKLAIVHFSRNSFVREDSNVEPYLEYFKHCEEIEIRGLRLQGTSVLDLPKLKVLVLSESPADRLVLNCPSLKVLFWNRRIAEIRFQKPQKLKRLFCHDWPASVSVNGKFEALDYINLFASGRRELVADHLLHRMPKLKRFVIYSSDPQAALEIIRVKQKLSGLKHLEILFNGFRDPVQIPLDDEIGSVIFNRGVDGLFENYSKLVESSPWSVCIDYSSLFSKFKILPSNFFERFRELSEVEISAVTNYTHLLGFLKCCPFIQTLKLHWSKVKANEILDLAHALHPSLKFLVIVEEQPSDLIAIDPSFMRLFNLALLYLECTHLPIEFVRKIVARREPHLQAISFKESTSAHWIAIYFGSQSLHLVDFSCDLKTFQFSSLEQLISHMQSDPHLRSFLLS